MFDPTDVRAVNDLAILFAVSLRLADEHAAEVSATKEAERKETRYRALFDALDAGFCVIELKRDAQGQASPTA